MPKLIMHYAPGFLVVLRQDPCPGQNIPWGHGKFTQHRHDGCCDGTGTLHKIIHAHAITKADDGLILTGCKLK